MKKTEKTKELSYATCSMHPSLMFSGSDNYGVTFFFFFFFFFFLILLTVLPVSDPATLKEGREACLDMRSQPRPFPITPPRVIELGVRFRSPTDTLLFLRMLPLPPLLPPPPMLALLLFRSLEPSMRLLGWLWSRFSPLPGLGLRLLLLRRCKDNDDAEGESPPLIADEDCGLRRLREVEMECWRLGDIELCRLGGLLLSAPLAAKNKNWPLTGKETNVRNKESKYDNEE